jgi:hypothetical protein
MRLTPRGLAVASRNAIISRNFQVVDMQQWKGEGRRVECLDREVEHDAGVLADRIKHDRLFKLEDHVAHDLDGLSFQAAQMPRQRECLWSGQRLRTKLVGALIVMIPGRFPTR